jgi:hypothetical protein
VSVPSQATFLMIVFPIWPVLLQVSVSARAGWPPIEASNIASTRKRAAQQAVILLTLLITTSVSGLIATGITTLQKHVSPVERVTKFWIYLHERLMNSPSSACYYST